MRIVAALGGNALLERGEPPESGIQEAHVIKAVSALAAGNDLGITHGNGPQVEMPALESAHDPAISRPFPAGSMGPKIDAVCRFVEATGKPAAIGQLGDAEALLAQQAGTVITMTGR